MEKKTSIFSSLSGSSAMPFPSAKPAEASAPAPEVSALKQKIESLEKTIAAQERKLAEARSAPPPPPPPRPPEQGAQFLLAKMGELDKKFEEFARNSALSSAQMKTIEESKIGARREIEELLKVVRDQQKYSEMDRQMHDQLEKSWRRVEDLEKKLMDFYSTAMTRPAAAAQPALAAGEVEKIVEAGIRKFAADIEQKLKAVAEKLDGQSPALIRKSEEKISSMASDLDARLTAFEIEFRKMHVNMASSEEALRLLYDGIKGEMASALKDAVKEEHKDIRKHVDGFAAETEKRIDAMSKAVIGQAEAIMTQAVKYGLRLKQMESAFETASEKNHSDFAAMAVRMEEIFRKAAGGITESILAENAANAEKIMEFSRISAYNLSDAARVAGNVMELSERLKKLRNGMQTFIEGFKNVDFDSLPGVSGEIARRNYDGLRTCLKEIEQECAIFDSRRNDIAAHLKGMTAGLREIDK